jgi:polycomb protein EED
MEAESPGHLMVDPCAFRIWNIKTSVCVAMFAGDAGHLDEVLSCVQIVVVVLFESLMFFCQDWNLHGDKIVSSGMDHTIRIWDIDESLEELIKQSFDPAFQRNLKGTDVVEAAESLRPFTTKVIQFPLYFTRKVPNH